MTRKPVSIDDIPGLSYPQTYDALADLARNVPSDQAIVELGTYRGKSAVALASGAMCGEGAHVWTVDPHDLPGYRTSTGAGPRPTRPIDYTSTEVRESAEANITAAGMADRVTMIRGFSEDVGSEWTGPKVGLLFIDGDHREGAARRDFAAWERHLAKDAVIAWDDYRPHFPGVMNVVAKLVNKGLIHEPIVTGALAVTRRVER